MKFATNEKESRLVLNIKKGPFCDDGWDEFWLYDNLEPEEQKIADYLSKFEIVSIVTVNGVTWVEPGDEIDNVVYHSSVYEKE